jgi:hypothetical protein
MKFFKDREFTINIMKKVFYNDCIIILIKNLLEKNPILLSSDYLKCYKKFHEKYKNHFSLPDDILASYNMIDIFITVKQIGYYNFLLYIFSYYALQYKSEYYYPPPQLIKNPPPQLIKSPQHPLIKPPPPSIPKYVSEYMYHNTKFRRYIYDIFFNIPCITIYI